MENGDQIDVVIEQVGGCLLMIRKYLLTYLNILNKNHKI